MLQRSHLQNDVPEPSCAMGGDEPSAPRSPVAALIPSHAGMPMVLAARAICMSQKGFKNIPLKHGSVPLITCNVPQGVVCPLAGYMFCLALDVAGYGAFTPHILTRLKDLTQNMAKELSNEPPLKDLLNGIKHCLAGCLDLQAVSINPLLLSEIKKQ